MPLRPVMVRPLSGLCLIASALSGCGTALTPAPPVTVTPAVVTAVAAPPPQQSSLTVTSSRPPTLVATATGVAVATREPPATAPATLVRPAPTATIAARTTPGRMPQVPILTYHHLDVPQGGEYNVSSAQFARQMQWLADRGYQTITPALLLAAYTGTGTLPAHPVLITFDDNYREPYDLALPILKKHGFTATFFIMTVTIGKRFFMTADEIRQLEKDGFTIGGHTWDHPIMTNLTAAQLQQELDQSTADLTAVLGHRPVYFAYPDGVYDARVVAAVQAAGYSAAFRLSNRADPPVDPRYMIRRQDIAGPWSLHDFINNVHWMEP